MDKLEEVEGMCETYLSFGERFRSLPHHTGEISCSRKIWVYHIIILTDIICKKRFDTQPVFSTPLV